VLSSSGLTFEGQAGSPGPGTVAIDVTSDGEPVSGLSVRVQYPDEGPTGWIDASLDGDDTPATLSVTISTDALAWGAYAAAVIVDADDAGNESQAVVISVQLECRAPASGQASLCGRLHDTETGDVVRAALSVVAHDLLAYAADPGSSALLATAVTDASGRFRILDVAPPASGQLLLIADDGAGTDARVRTGSALPITGGALRTGVELFATRTSTDGQWTASAGSPFGAGTFSSEGAVLSIFRQDATPTANVQVTGGTSAVSYYFSDTQGSLRFEVSTAATSTGPNGSALTVGGGLDSYSGTGAEPAGTSWSSGLAGDVPGLIWVIVQSPLSP
jgi:hypothetical protein